MFLSIRIPSLYTFTNENRPLWALKAKSTAQVANQTTRSDKHTLSEREERACVSYGLTETRLWFGPDQCTILCHWTPETAVWSPAIKEQRLSLRINEKDYDTGAEEAVYTVCDVLFPSLISESAVTNASYVYRTSCFCAVTVNFLEIFVLDWDSPDLRTKHSSGALNLTFGAGRNIQRRLTAAVLLILSPVSKRFARYGLDKLGLLTLNIYKHIYLKKKRLFNNTLWWMNCVSKQRKRLLRYDYCYYYIVVVFVIFIKIENGLLLCNNIACFINYYFYFYLKISLLHMTSSCSH